MWQEEEKEALGRCDSKLKLLISNKPQEFVSWLVGEATYEKEVSPHLQARNIDADILYQIIIDECAYLLHIEFQLEADADMAERLWEYNVLATRKYSLPVYSFVIYLKKSSKVVGSPYVCLGHTGQDIHRFHFQVIKLWEIPTVQMKNLGFQGLLPLLPLTREGKKREVIEEVIEGLSKDKQEMPKDLLALAFGLASLIFKDKGDEEWLQRRFGMLDDLLRESWAFRGFFEEGKQEGVRQGIEEGKKEGLKEGLKEGKKEGLEESLHLSRQTAIALFEHYYPVLVPLARKKVDSISDQQALQQLILQISMTHDQDEVRKYLENL